MEGWGHPMPIMVKGAAVVKTVGWVMSSMEAKFESMLIVGEWCGWIRSCIAAPLANPPPPPSAHPPPTPQPPQPPGQNESNMGQTWGQKQCFPKLLLVHVELGLRTFHPISLHQRPQNEIKTSLFGT